MKFLPIFFLLLIISLSLTSAIPELPMIISGHATINDKVAKSGTEISAKIGDEEIVNTEVADNGSFDLILQKLSAGQEVEFYVDGIYSNQSVLYKSGDFEQLSLKVEKSYVVYYAIGALIVLIGAGIIWKYKTKKRRKK